MEMEGRRRRGGERERERDRETERQRETERDRERQRIHVNTHHILCQGPQTTLHFDVTSQHNSIRPLQTPISHRIALHSPRFTLVVSAAKEKREKTISRAGIKDSRNKLKTRKEL